MPQTYKIPTPQNIFDALINISVPLDSTITILKDSGYGIDTDFDTTIGTLTYERASIVIVKGGQIPVVTPSDLLTYITNSQQNVYDVCLNTVGDLNKIIFILKENNINFSNINIGIEGGITVNYNKINVTNNGFKLVVKKQGIDFTTSDLIDVEELELLMLQEDGYYLLLESGDYLLY